jgi:short-chain fatty acids transporter
MEIVNSWGSGFWVYLTFTMQMVLLLMTGMTLASSPQVSRALKKLAGSASGRHMPYIVVFLACAAAYYVNWGLAVIVGAILAREVGKQNPNIHFPLLVAAAYAPTTLYPAGLSSSIGLAIATEGHFLSEIMGVIPTSATIFSPATITIFIALVITMPIVITFMAPKNQDDIIPWKGDTTPDDGENDREIEEKGKTTPAQKIDNNKIIGRIAGAVGVAYILNHFWYGGDFNLNIINLLFLSLGLVLHNSLKEYSEAFSSAATSISPIILQFPFYAGIIAILGSSALGEMIVGGITSVANATNFNLFTYWSAGLVNILAPSGGGQWALQGPLQIPAALELGVDPAKTAMAVAWGDAWTNLIQPFWALPILSVVGLHIRHIMGYCILLSVWVGALTSVMIYFLY